MPPKGAKKGSAKKSSTDGGAVNKNWETGLIKAEFEEDSWQACVSFVVGRGPQEEELIQALALAVQEPQRKLFTLLTWDDTLVTEPAKLLLDAGEGIPCDPMAKILKFQLLLIKACYQQRSDANQTTVSDKKGKGPHTPVIPPKEKKTKLKRRGDVEPPTFKDDEPEWGPQHYILILGFYQPQLIAGLDAIGVHVSNVIKLCLEFSQNMEEQQDHQDSCEGNEQSLRASPERKLNEFWSGLRSVLDSGPPDSRLHDVVQLSYTVPHFFQIFDGVASLIYDCLDVRRQYQQYRNNVKFISVPAVVKHSEPVEVNICRYKNRLLPLSLDVDMCYYNNLLDLVAPEACSVPLILHCMLEQVCVHLVVQDFDPTEVELSMMRLSPVWEMIESVTQQKNRKSCWMSIKQQLQHYCTDGQNLCLRPRVNSLYLLTSVLEAMPLSGVDQQGVLRGIADPAQQQTSIVIPWDDPLSFAKQQLYNMRNKACFNLKKKKTAMDPVFFPQEQSGRVCSHLDLPDIQSCRLRSLFHWRYAEHHNATLLQLASEEYCCLDTFRGSHNNILYVFCHNPMSPQRQSREFWHVALHTDVKFRCEMMLVTRGIVRNLLLIAFMDVHVCVIAMCWNRVLTPGFIKEPTLNYFRVTKVLHGYSIMVLQAWKLEQERQKEEEIPKKSKKEDLPKDKQQKKEDKSTDNKKKKTSSDDKKSRPGSEGSSANPPTESAITTAPPGFTGYIMDGKLIHVSGCLQYLFPSDGGRVTVETVSFVQGTGSVCVLHESKQTFNYKLTNSLLRQYRKLQTCDTSLSKELSRIITSQGAVIRYMRDGSTEVLFADGSVSFSQDSGPVWVPDSETGVPLNTKQRFFCLVMSVMLNREDLVVSVQNPDGSVVVEHADGTRITSLLQERPMNANPHCLLRTGDQQAHKRMVLVEKEGCATVVMYPERQTAHIFLADGTVVTGNNQREYEVFPSSVGVLSIRSDGTCVYSSDPLVTPSPKGSTPTEQTGIYTMSHMGKVACEITDPDGNHFQVSFSDHKIVSLCCCAVCKRILSSRLFLVHGDGSGTELLSSQTVKELLCQAYLDPTIALLKEQLFGITILKPSHQSVWSQWLLNKQNPEITPPNLRNRSWHDFPAVEKKSPGPPFGTDVVYNLGLRMRPAGSAVHHRPVRSCPKVLELRELYQHRPFTTPLKNTIDSRLKEYIESLMEREQRSEKMKVKDPRSEEETAHASDLINLILIVESLPGLDGSVQRQIILYMIYTSMQTYELSCVCLCACTRPGESSWRDSSRKCKSPQLDVSGKPRQTTVTLPSSVLGSKSCSAPVQNHFCFFCQKCAGRVFGFQLIPSSVDFGTLKEGTSSTIIVVMKNVGFDICRFHVKQPPPATGLRVIYSPGPVAAGLQVELKVQLFAMCAVQAGEVEPKKLISQEIIIPTEKDILCLPVTANIL
uniref:Sperm associated antigen 17 n=1 Tax=Astatotilapia calliptera TaxID=8154 RepID=A0A3P8QUV4_ASTCA